VRRFAQKNKLSIETAGRQLRMEFFYREMRRRHGLLHHWHHEEREMTMHSVLHLLREAKGWVLIVWLATLNLSCGRQPVSDAAGSAAGSDSGAGTERDHELVSPTDTQHRLATYAYDCGEMFVVAHFPAGSGEVVLFRPAETSRLSLVPAASGAKYSNGTVTFWTKGSEEAILELADGTLLNCRVDRARSLLEDAKLRGVDYRAQGNEPGWLLEIGPDRILFEYDYGTQRAIFPLPDPQVDAKHHRTVYSSANESQTLQVVIEGHECRDTMRGDLFATSVMVILTGRSFRGCGQALH